MEVLVQENVFNECSRYPQTIKREHVVLNNRCVLELEGVERKCALKIGDLVKENGGHDRFRWYYKG